MKWQPIKKPQTSRKYREEAIRLAFEFSPQIYPCMTCGHPWVHGYHCYTCGSPTPDLPKGENG
jgi:hypothetical protein